MTSASAPSQQSGREWRCCIWSCKHGCNTVSRSRCGGQDRQRRTATPQAKMSPTLPITLKQQREIALWCRNQAVQGIAAKYRPSTQRKYVDKCNGWWPQEQGSIVQKVSEYQEQGQAWEQHTQDCLQTNRVQQGVLWTGHQEVLQDNGP